MALQSPDEDHPTTHLLTLSGTDHTITIEYQHTLVDDGNKLAIEARAKMSRRFLDSAEEAQIEAKPSSVQWWDRCPWASLLRTEYLNFTLAATKLDVTLGLGLAGPSLYYLNVWIVTETLPISPAASLQPAQGEGLERLALGSGGQADAQDDVAEAGTSEGDCLNEW